jgi:hypothetical protein
VRGENGDALLTPGGKEFWRVALAIKDDGEAVPQRIGCEFFGAGLAGHLVLEPGDDLLFEDAQKPVIDRTGDDEKGLAVHGR